MDFVLWAGTDTVGERRVFPHSAGWMAPSGTVLSAGQAPADLLRFQENGVGTETHIYYLPSTRWNLAVWSDQSARPSSAGSGRLPFVSWVVAKLVQQDALCGSRLNGCLYFPSTTGTLTTYFDYALARFDPVDREFRGFGRVETRRYRGSGSPLETALTQTLFYQDAVRQGQVRETALFRESGSSRTLIRKTQNDYRCAELLIPFCVETKDYTGRTQEQCNSAQWRRASQFTLDDLSDDCPMSFTTGSPLPRFWWMPLRQTTDASCANAEGQWSDCVTPAAVVTENWAWDDYGNVLRVVRSESGPSWANATVIQEVTDYAYADTPSRYLVTKPKRHLVVEGMAWLELKWFVYDDLPYGSVDKGNLTQAYAWLERSPNSQGGVACPETGVPGQCIVTSTQYNDYGLVTRATDPRGAQTTFAYDAGRVVERIDPAGKKQTVDWSTPWQSVTYDECHHELAECGGRGLKTVERFDGSGRVKERIQYETGSSGQVFKARTTYGYDALGRQTVTRQHRTEVGETATDPLFTVEYDSLGRKVKVNDPDSGTWYYGYDRGGNLIYQNDPKTAQSIRTSYDVLGRPVLRRVMGTDNRGCEAGASGCPVWEGVRYYYDAIPATFLSCTTDPVPAYSCPTMQVGTQTVDACHLGRRTAVEYLDSGLQPTGNWSATCLDLFGRTRRAVESITPLRSGFPAVRARMLFDYDVAGSLTRVTYPDGEQVTYSYDTGYLYRAEGA